MIGRKASGNGHYGEPARRYTAGTDSSGWFLRRSVQPTCLDPTLLQRMQPKR